MCFIGYGLLFVCIRPGIAAAAATAAAAAAAAIYLSLIVEQIEQNK